MNKTLPICLSTNGVTQSITTEPATTMFVATIDGVLTFERADANTIWKQTNQTLQGSHISSLLFEKKSGLLFAGCHYKGGIKVSADGGKNWVDCNTGLASEHAYSLNVQYVADKTVLYAGTEPPMIYRSTDLGKSWQAIREMWNVPDTDQWRFPPPPHLSHVKNVAFHPDHPDTLYTCIEQGDLLKTLDGGKSWKTITSYEKADHRFRRDMHRVVIVPSNPEHIYLTAGVGMFESENGGDTWECRTDSEFRVGYPDPLFIEPTNEKIIYMTGAQAAPNPTWNELRSARPGIVRSMDGGKTWTDLTQGLPSPIPGNTEAMAMNHCAGITSLYIGTAVGEIYMKKNALDDGPNAAWILVSSDVPPISKGAHFRRFLSTDDRAKVEAELRSLIPEDAKNKAQPQIS